MEKKLQEIADLLIRCEDTFRTAREQLNKAQIELNCAQNDLADMIDEMRDEQSVVENALQGDTPAPKAEPTGLGQPECSTCAEVGGKHDPDCPRKPITANFKMPMCKIDDGIIFCANCEAAMALVKDWSEADGPFCSGKCNDDWQRITEAAKGKPSVTNLKDVPYAEDAYFWKCEVPGCKRLFALWRGATNHFDETGHAAFKGVRPKDAGFGAADADERTPKPIPSPIKTPQKRYKISAEPQSNETLGPKKPLDTNRGCIQGVGYVVHAPSCACKTVGGKD